MSGMGGMGRRGQIGTERRGLGIDSLVPPPLRILPFVSGFLSSPFHHLAPERPLVLAAFSLSLSLSLYSLSLSFSLSFVFIL